MYISNNFCRTITGRPLKPPAPMASTCDLFVTNIDLSVVVLVAINPSTTSVIIDLIVSY